MEAKGFIFYSAPTGHTYIFVYEDKHLDQVLEMIKIFADSKDIPLSQVEASLVQQMVIARSNTR